MEFRLCRYQGAGTINCSIEYQTQQLTLCYEVSDCADLVWPDYQGLERRDELWQSTCFELFISNEGESSYDEINLSPCGGWNCYSFDSYRTGMKTSQNWAVTSIMEPNSGRLIARLEGKLMSSTVKLGPSAVLARNSSELGYYAITHGDKPDFHHPDRHVLVTLNDL